MNARREAFERLGKRYEVRVLEPSPPAVDEPPNFADDPVASATGSPDRLVTPVEGRGITWNELALSDQALAPWCAER